MSLFSALTAAPSSIVAGRQEVWSETLTDYPVASYSVAYVFSAPTTPVDGAQRFTVTGSESSTATYTFTFPANTKPGRYQWEKRITRSSDGVVRVANSGCLTIQPDLSVAQTESYAQAQVAAIKSNLTSLAASANVSVSFNGQSFTRSNIQDLRGQLAYWEGQVAKEQAALNALTDNYCRPTGRIVTRFSRYGGANTCDSTC